MMFNYTHVAYADSLAGDNFTLGAPLGRKFIGFRQDNESPIESTDYRDYQWMPYAGLAAE